MPEDPSSGSRVEVLLFGGIVLARERTGMSNKARGPEEIVVTPGRLDLPTSPGQSESSGIRPKHLKYYSVWRSLLALLFVACVLDSAAAQQATSRETPELPGPSQALHAAPFYSCLRNFYVATNGRDSNPGTQAQPWLTIQHADAPSRRGGDCINVEGGTYKANLLVQHGGTAPTPTGYVVYRCQALGACRVVASHGGHVWGFRNGGNFVVVDGFEVDGNDSLRTDGIADACLATDDQTYGPGNSTHHIWLINNTVHHCNMSGISLAWKEWYYVIHNTVYHNSYTSGWQGSGISLVVIECMERADPSCHSGSTYVPSEMDLSFAPPFHNVISWNDVHNNMLSVGNPVPCGSHSDGNGIILDTFLDGATNKVAFPYRTLVLGNLSYSNGGRGIHAFRASNITVANNTVYGNGTDNCINGFAIGDLSQQGGSNNVWINNISQSVLSQKNPGCGRYCGSRNAPVVAGDAAGVTDTNIIWSNNVAFGGNGVMLFNNDATVPYFSCNDNRCNVDPLLANPAAGNFALQPSSPAVGFGKPQSYFEPGRLYSGACASGIATCP
jgi:parallel beta-helix repeat protein